MSAATAVINNKATSLSSGGENKILALVDEYIDEMFEKSGPTMEEERVQSLLIAYKLAKDEIARLETMIDNLPIEMVQSAIQKAAWPETVKYRQLKKERKISKHEDITGEIRQGTKLKPKKVKRNFFSRLFLNPPVTS